MDSEKADLDLLRQMISNLDGPVREAAAEVLSRLERAFERKDTENRMLLDAIPAMMWLKDTDNRILRCNRSAAETAGASVTQMEGRHTAEFYPDEADKYWQDDRAVIASGHPKLGIVEPYRLGSGEKIWVRTDKIPYRDDGDRVVGVLVFATDISELKRAQDERDRVLELERRARADAEIANRLKEEFLAALSHELRTPLTSILGYAELLAEKKLTNDVSARALASIVRNARAQVQMVEDLLSTSRIISGGVEIDPTSIDVQAAVEEAVETARPLAEAKEQTLVVRCECPGATAHADPRRFQQILWNLVSNAIKFTPAGGKVEVIVAQDSGTTRISVRDDGEGIAGEALPFVFDRFWQAERGVTRRHRGLGIGLTLVKHLVEAHGGTVEAHSEGVGKGSTFTFDLPLKRDA